MSSSSPQTYPVAAEGAEFNPTNIFKFIYNNQPVINRINSKKGP